MPRNKKRGRRGAARGQFRPRLHSHKKLNRLRRYFDIPKDEALKRANEQIKFFQLEEKRDVPIAALSGGMKRRLIFARALINQPQILLLDEPTTGLDPQARHLAWDEVRNLKKKASPSY